MYRQFRPVNHGFLCGLTLGPAEVEDCRQLNNLCQSRYPPIPPVFTWEPGKVEIHRCRAVVEGADKCCKG